MKFLANNNAKVTIILSTLGVLQIPPSVIYDSLKVLHKYLNQVVVDGADQTVDTKGVSIRWEQCLH